MGNAHWIIAPNILNQTTVGYNKTDGPATHVFPTKNWNDLGVPITLDQSQPVLHSVPVDQQH